MSTELATSTAPATNPAPIEVSDGDAMTPAEKAYFQSRGSDASGLVSSQPAPVEEQKVFGDNSKNPPEQNDEDGDEDGEVELGADGSPRDPKTGRFVPKPAFLRVKGELKQTKQEAQKYRDNLIAARERLAILTEAAQPRQAQQEAPDDLADAPDIDPEVDVFGALKQANARLKRFEASMRQTQTQTTQMKTAAAFQNDVTRFKAKAPDWEQAFAHVANHRRQVLSLLGGEPEAVNSQIEEEARHLIETTLKNGRSAAEMFYEIAKTMGYQPKGQQDTNALQKAAEDLQRLEANKQAGASLRGAGTGGVGEQITQAQLANMSEDDYMRTRERVIAKSGLAAWEKLKRGG